MNHTIHRTRFETLGFINQLPGLWRFIDLSDYKPQDPPRTVGPQYRTKAELLADLARYARDSWGFE